MPPDLEIDKAWMQKAIHIAKQSGDDIPVGACLVSASGELLASAHNQKEKSHDPTAHAEILVIRQATAQNNNWRLSDTILYTTLEPCPMCAEAILQSRIAKVVFGAYDPVSGALGSKFNLYTGARIYPAPQTLGGILEDECAALLKEFFRKRDTLSK
jgi:tRNA(adenine34) deaminase